MARFNRTSQNSEPAASGPPAKKRNTAGLQYIEPRCNVCKSAYRNTIDRMLTLGVSYAELSRQFADAGINRKNLANHHHKHVDIEQRAIREVLEEEARRIGQSVEEGKRLIVNRRSYMEVAMMKSYAAIVDGRLTPEPRDVVQMINLMEKFDEKTASVQIETMQRDLNAFIEAVKKVVPAAMYDEIIDQFNRMLRLQDGIEETFDSYAVEAPDYSTVELPKLAPGTGEDPIIEQKDF